MLYSPLGHEFHAWSWDLNSLHYHWPCCRLAAVCHCATVANTGQGLTGAGCRCMHGCCRLRRVVLWWLRNRNHVKGNHGLLVAAAGAVVRFTWSLCPGLLLHDSHSLLSVLPRVASTMHHMQYATHQTGQATYGHRWSLMVSNGQ
jgi:hypothetical protein